jgi:integrase
LRRLRPHDLRRRGATIAQAARLPVDFVKALLNHNDKGVTDIYARWHMFEEKREAIWRLKRRLPLMPISKALAA